MDIWKEVEKLVGESLKTLAQRKVFSIISMSNSSLTILVGSSKKERRVSRDEIIDSATHLFSYKKLSRMKIRDSFSEANPAYVAAILSKLPGVLHFTSPIELVYREGKL